jgi:hypothetical protein
MIGGGLVKRGPTTAVLAAETDTAIVCSLEEKEREESEGKKVEGEGERVSASASLERNRWLFPLFFVE